jgi:hypothetical protein
MSGEGSDEGNGDSPYTEQAGVPVKSGAIIEASFHRRLDSLLGRICRIHRGVGAYGSGFLVGPNLIMTAKHVADSLVAKPWPGDRIYVSFPAPSFESSRALVSFEIEAFSPIASCPDLDYAVIRIPVNVGLMKFSQSSARGWFQICNVAFQELEGRSLVVLHWPSRGTAPRIPGTESTTAAWSAGQVVEFDHKQSRGLHNAATEKGSSGGICLVGLDCKPLYVHTGTKEGLNIATSLKSVSDHIRKNFPELLHELEELPSIRFLPRFTQDNWPIINRDDIIIKLLEITEGSGPRPLFIHGASSTGRSFVFEILKTTCSFAKHLKLDLASNLGSYQNLLSLLRRTCPQPDEISNVFLETEPIEAYFRRNLQNFLNACNRHAQQNGRVFSTR